LYIKNDGHTINWKMLSWNEMLLADPVYGIFGATPVSTMHVLCKGIIE